MRRPTALLLLLGLATAPSFAADPPRRILSANLCADRLVLALAEPGTVISVSLFAADPEASTVVDQTAGLILNHGDAEEIAALHPDLAVFGSFAGSAADLVEKLGIPVYRLPVPDDLAGMRSAILTLASRLGVPARGDRLVAEIDRRLASMRRPHGPTRVAITSAGGWTHGRHTIDDEILGALGVDNLASLAGVSGIGNLPLEALIALQPALIVVEGLGLDRPSLRAHSLSHPVLRDAGIRRLEMPMKLWACADAALLDGAQLIADALP